jgi:2,3-bisphosphoglycerate-independent phosphoglycerate mutase
VDKKVLVVILDGFGEGEERPDNAVLVAGMPQYNALRARGRCGRLHTSGPHVGLPEGQMGNSEVGHLTLGSGRLIKQTIMRVSEAAERGDFAGLPALRQLGPRLAPEATLHLIGLASDGGVHSCLSHFGAAARAALANGAQRVAVHVFTDGRDTAQKSALKWLKLLDDDLPPEAFIATVGGRYFGMDRDQRWDRVEAAWRVIVDGEGEPSGTAEAAVLNAYQRGETDEFITPVPVVHQPIEDGDAVWLINFRADRMRQLTAALSDPSDRCFERTIPRLSALIGMIEYRSDLEVEVLFEPQVPNHTLGEVVAAAGLRQLRIAETEKYAHVTYFFNGGAEALFAGESRILVPSPRDVATYDQRPLMSAPEVTRRLIAELESGRDHLIVVNYANPDMIGHTGDMDAAVAALQGLDLLLGKLVATAEAEGYAVLITADHGNIEEMLAEDGSPATQHTTGPVPVVLLGFAGSGPLADGSLRDVAPTVLDQMGLPVPTAMDGRVLVLER